MKKRIRTDVNKEKLIKHLIRTGGNVSLACENAVLSRTQFYYWLKYDSTFKKEVDNVYLEIRNFTQSKLLQLATRENPQALIKLRNIIDAKLHRSQQFDD